MVILGGHSPGPGGVGGGRGEKERGMGGQRDDESGV